jgi:hemerythrin-like domain-containing protein
MHRISSPGSREPAATFEQPFEMLSACHDRVRRSLKLLHRLAVHAQAHGADHRARDAARDVLRYFTVAAPAHHEDEERHVIPALRASGDPRALEAAQRLLDDHEQIREAWSELQPLLDALAGGTMPELQALQRAAQRFADVHTDHLVLEDSFAFPRAKDELSRHGEQAMLVMGGEMAQRRGVAAPTPSAAASKGA